ncbi:MAG: fasciclin domain-containing protein [Pseudonocardia sp.]|nr:fasciclin domain-containing protein [Pseudonocardia sp.]
MRKTQRFATLGAIAAMAITLTACGGGTAAPAAPDAPAAPPAASAPETNAPAAASGGVTTPADVFGPACSKLPQGDAPGSLTAMGPQPVATAASTNPLLTTLVAAVGAANLGDTLNSQKAITVFAPYDPAFAAVKEALGADKFAALLKDTKTLSSILTLHVVGTRYDASGLTEAKTVKSLAGGELTISGNKQDGLTVTDPAGNTAKVLCGNIPTSNATVFVIDKVLMPKA